MNAERKKPEKKPPGRPGRAGSRNPFAGRPRSGAGFHSDTKYGKKDRRENKPERDAQDESDDADS